MPTMTPLAVNTCSTQPARISRCVYTGVLSTTASADIGSATPSGRAIVNLPYVHSIGRARAGLSGNYRDPVDAVPGDQRAVIAPAKRRRRRRIEIVWVMLTVVYGLGRAVVVGVTLGQYGVNPWVYAAIDAATSVPLGLGT